MLAHSLCFVLSSRLVIPPSVGLEKGQLGSNELEGHKFFVEQYSKEQTIVFIEALKCFSSKVWSRF